MSDKRPHLLFFVTEDWYFLSHRLPVALAAIKQGYRVSLVTRINKDADEIAKHGIHLIPVNVRRGSFNPLRDVSLLYALIRIYRKHKPDIVHHVAMKPVLYGTIAARLSRVPAIVNAMAGFGFLFTSKSRKISMIRGVFESVLKIIFAGCRQRLIIQNPDDKNYLLSKKIATPEVFRVIKGSGVDTNVYTCSELPIGQPVVLLASRMLRDKGINEFVDAAMRLNTKGVSARFLLAGDADGDNPSSIPVSTLNGWNNSGCIEWLGRVDDVPALMRKANIVCLPSYREGLPKVLVEAASCCRPVVATDVPGCREIVRKGETGLLVPPQNAELLADAIAQLLESPDQQKEMGQSGRRLVEDQFSLQQVVAQTLVVYQELLD